MVELSPAAQAVLDAFLKTPGEEPMLGWDYGRDLAAALRAAATQVVPTTVDPRLSTVRSDLMRIARELEQS
jgi:hypothetical protein